MRDERQLAPCDLPGGRNNPLAPVCLTPGRRLTGGWPVALLMILVLLAACREPASVTPAPASPAAGQAEPLPTLVSIPTVWPSATPFPSITPLTPVAVAPTSASTAIPFDQLVVDIRYAIPALGLDRRLEGTLGSRLRVTDLVTGQSTTRSNQPSLLLELQQVLRTLELAPLPADCDACVQVSYALPASDLAASGWLTDSLLLLSLENFTSVHLGPHFPPGTVLGLRRSPSSVSVAHTLAVLADGRYWFWAADDDRLAEPEAAPEGLLAALANVDRSALTSPYAARCDGVPIETLRLGGVESALTVEIVCPEQSLPWALLPLYVEMDALIAEQLAGRSDYPAGRVAALGMLLEYRRADGARLTVTASGDVVAVVDGTETISATLTVAERDELHAALLAAGEALAPDRPTGDSDAAAAPNQLVVRGASGLVTAGWIDAPPAPLADAVAELDALLATLAGQLSTTPAPAPTATEAP